MDKSGGWIVETRNSIMLGGWVWKQFQYRIWVAWTERQLTVFNGDKNNDEN